MARIFQARRFNVVKVDKQTREELGVVFSGLSEAQANRSRREKTECLTPEEKQHIEFQVSPGIDYRQIEVKSS